MKGIGRIIDMLISSNRSGNVSFDYDGLLEYLANSEYNPKDEPDYKSKDKHKDKSKVKSEDNVENKSKDKTDEYNPYWWIIPYQKGLRLILVISAAVMMITVILYYGIRYLNDVILYENQLTINEQGAFNPQKSLNCEYANYLFNTADLWANSGIQVNENDRIRINISGGYNSWVNGAVNAAKNNTALLFPWVSYDTIYNEQDTSLGNSIDYCISRGDKGYRFGSAMYAIAPESWNLQDNPLRLQNDEQKNGFRQRLTGDTIKTGSRFLWKINDVFSNKYRYRLFRLGHPDSRDIHPAGKTGTLFFAVNDMYFDKNDTINLDIMRSFFNDSTTRSQLGEDFCKKAISGHKSNPKFDYDDNLGQLLVSVEIQRYVPFFFIYPTMAYRFLEYHVNETLDSIFIPYDNCDILRLFNWLTKFIICFIWFIAFLVWIILLFGFYMIALFVIIYTLFLLGHRLFKIWDWVFPEKQACQAKTD